MTSRLSILFVDDEAMILQGLQRSLRSLRAEWDLAFVTSGQEALKLMERQAFDVVVSDMRMPGMNGAVLLNEVMRLHPATLRIVLSGDADHDLLLNCVGSTHQFLAKPCDPVVLQSTLERAATLQRAVGNDQLRQLVSRMGCVPSLPQVYSEMVAALQDERTTLAEVAEVIGRDLGMTAQMLKLVNSAFFGLPREIASASEAVGYLGVDTIKSLVLSLHAFAQFEGTLVAGFSLPALWTHSLETAGLARHVADAESADGKLRDEAFAAGLLHDVGKLVLAANFPGPYGAVLHRVSCTGIPLIEAEAQDFGASHATVGGYLLGLWGLPVPLVEAIALHHHPGGSGSADFCPLTAVHAANLIVQGQTTRVDQAYLQKLGLADRLDAWIELHRDTAAPANPEPVLQS